MFRRTPCDSVRGNGQDRRGSRGTDATGPRADTGDRRTGGRGAAGRTDAFGPRAGTKTGEQGRRLSDTVRHFRLVGFHVGPLRGEIPPAATTIPIPSRKHCNLSHAVPRVPFGPSSLSSCVVTLDERDGSDERDGRGDDVGFHVGSFRTEISCSGPRRHENRRSGNILP